MKRRIFYFILGLLFLNSNLLHATHIMGADITFRIIDSNTGKYRVTLILYQDCQGVNYNIFQELEIYKTGLPMYKEAMTYRADSSREVTPLCLPPDVIAKEITNCPGPLSPLNPNGIKGVWRWYFEKDIVLGKSGLAILGWRDGNRNIVINTIENPNLQPIWIQAFLNLKYANSSHVFNSAPIPYMCKEIKNVYNHGALEKYEDKYMLIEGVLRERDSLVYLLVCPMISPGTLTGMGQLNNPCVTFKPGLNKNNFLYTTNSRVDIDYKSGDISCIPNQNQDAIMAVAIKEFRAIPKLNGGYDRVEISHIMRDIQFTVRDNCSEIISQGVLEDSLINANFVSSNEVDICGTKNGKIVFKLIGPAFQNLKTSIEYMPSNQKMFGLKYTDKIQSSNNEQHLYGTIIFDSTSGFGNDKLVLKVYYCNSVGIKVFKHYTLKINFRPAVKVPKKIRYYCQESKPIRLSVSGGTKYTWTPKHKIMEYATDSSWITVAPDTNIVYTVKAIDGIDSTISCNITDQVRVYVLPKFKYTLSPKEAQVCLHDTIQVQLKSLSLDTPFLFRWTDPTSSMFHPLTNLRATNLSNPKIIATKTSKYLVEIENQLNCIYQDSITIDLKGVRPNASGWSARNLICPGDSTMLFASVSPKTCGPSIYKSLSSENEIIYKTILSQVYPQSNTTNPSLCYPNPFIALGAGQSSSSRFIYTKSELVSAGLKPGVIKSISIQVAASIAQDNISQFEIRIGSTKLTDAKIDIPSFSVYKTSSFSLLGNPWKDFSFTQGFDWDGESNLMIETHTSTSSPFSSPNFIQTAQVIAGNQTAYKYSDILGVSAENSPGSYVSSSGTSNFSKPIIKFRYSRIDSSDLNLLTAIWSPTSLINRAPSIAPASPRAIATASQHDSLFILTIGKGICVDTAQVKVKADPNFVVKINQIKKVYCLGAATNVSFNLMALVPNAIGTSLQWSSLPADASINSTTNSQSVIQTIGTKKYIIQATNLPCITSDTIEILVQPNLPLSLTVNAPLCTSSSGKLKAILPNNSKANEYKFYWNSNPSDFQPDSLVNIAPGIFNLEIRQNSDSNCRGTASINMKANIISLSILDSNSGIKCHNGKADSIWVSVQDQLGSGQYQFKWATSTSDVTHRIQNKPIGNYLVTVTDNITGCIGVKNHLLSQPNPISISIENLVHVKCKGDQTGSIKINVLGGTPNFNYKWIAANNLNLPLVNQLSNLYAENIKLIVTDANACQDSLDIVILEPTKKLVIDTIIIQNTSGLNLCDGSAKAFISGGTPSYNYYWNISARVTSNVISTSDKFDLLCKGIHQLSVTDNNGCIAKSQVEIIDLKCDWKTNFRLDHVKCNGDKTGIIYVIGSEINNSAATLWYKYILTDINGNSFDITNPNLTPQDTVKFVNFKAGIYSVEITTNLGCKTIISNIVLKENPKIQAQISPIQPSCKGYNDAQVIADVKDKFSPFKYDWGYGLNSDSFISNQESGSNKRLVVQNALGCLDSFIYNIDTPVGIQVFPMIDSIKCFKSNDGRIRFNVLPAYPIHPYLFVNKPGISLLSQDNYSNLAEGISKGNYLTKIIYKNPTNDKFCEERLAIVMSEPLELKLENLKIDPITCPNSNDGKINFSLSGGTIGNLKGYEYSIDGGSNFISGNKFNSLSSGIYNVVARDNNNCQFAKRVEVPSPEELYIEAKSSIAPLVLELGKSTKLSFDQKTRSGNLPLIQNIHWSSSHGLSCTDCPNPIATPYLSLTYHLEVNYHKNCIAKSSVIVPVENVKDFFVPNAFSPGDLNGLNDQVLVYGNAISKLKFQIFNRWGELVFESDHITKGWNGMYRGIAQPSGVYTYQAFVTYINGELKTKSGSITLIR